MNIDVAYTIFTGVRLVILTEDTEKARAALDLNGAAELGQAGGRGVAR